MSSLLTASPLLGAERPRVELRPESVRSWGAEAVELARLAGMVLEPWQVDGLELMLLVRPDGRWACRTFCEVCARQNGKSAMLYARALAGLFILKEKSIMWSAHLYETALLAFLKLEEMIDTLVEAGLVEPVRFVKTNGKEAILIGSGESRQSLKFFARSANSGRGFTGDLNVIDEAFAFTDAQQSAMMPTKNARPNAQMLYASSPPLSSDSGGPMFRLRKRAESGDVGLGWRDWGLPGDLDELAMLTDDDRAVFLADRANWAASNPALGLGRVDDESILDCLKDMAELDFAREILGVWPPSPEDGGRVIRPAAWDARTDPESVLVSQPVMGLDVDPERTRCAILAGGRNAAGMEHLEVAEHRPGVDWVVARAVELDERHEPAAWLIDPAGPAGPLIEPLRAAGLYVVEVTGREWAQACGGLYDAVHAQPPVMVHLGDKRVARSVAAGRKRDVGDGGWAWGRRTSEDDITIVCALTLARHGISKYVSDLVDNVW